MQQMRWLLYMNSLASLVGGAWLAALTLAAFRTSHSIAVLGAVWLIRIVTRVALQPIAGVMVDRWRSFRGLVLSFVVAALAALTGMATVSSHSTLIITLLVLVGVFQILDLFNGPGTGKLLQISVLPKELPRFNALQLTYGRTAAIIGPIVGGLTEVYGSIVYILLAYAVISLVFAIFVSLIPVQPMIEDVASSFWRSIKDGLGYAYTRKDIAAILILAATASGGWRLVEILIPALSAKTTAGYVYSGPLYSLVAVGSIAMGIVLAQHKKIYPFHWLIWSQLINIIPFLIFIWIPTAWGLAIAMLVTGMNADFHGVVTTTYLQSTVPNQFYGRTIALYRTMLAAGALPIIAVSMLHGLSNVPTLSMVSVSFLILGAALAWYLSVRHRPAELSVIFTQDKR